MNVHVHKRSLNALEYSVMLSNVLDPSRTSGDF